MADSEKCGKYEIYEDESDGWWVVKDTTTGDIMGKFISKDDALNKVALFMDDDDDSDDESGSVC